MKEKVSIITPVYNCEKYIKRCIQSLLEQTYKEIEIIMVDDGSKDRSADVIKTFQNSNDNIIYMYQENSGPGVARNRAIQKATGKYLLFVDSDDYLRDDYIEELVEIAEKNKSQLVIAGYTMVFEDGRNEIKVIPEFYKRNTSEEWAYRISACCSRMYLREFWRKNNIMFSEERDARAEDVPIVLFSNVMAQNIAIMKNAGYYYYQHSNSAMNTKSKKVLFKFPYKAFEEMYEKAKYQEKENSIDFYNMGVLKFLAQFWFVIYRRASKDEKIKFLNFIKRVIGKELDLMTLSWKNLRGDIELPFIYKVAIDCLIIKLVWRKKYE